MLKTKIVYVVCQGDSEEETKDLNMELNFIREEGFEIVDVKPYLERATGGYNFLVLYKDKSNGL